MTTNMSIKSRMAIVRAYVVKMAEKAERSLLEACKRNDVDTAGATMAELLKMAAVRQAADEAFAAMPDTQELPTYHVSSIFLKKAAQALTRGPDEDLMFATGLMVSRNNYAITELLTFKLAAKSLVTAQGDQRDVTRVLIYLDQHNHKLFMTLHSHPGSGKDATHPSPIDRDFHRRLELGNYPTIGAIFDRQGYVRFYSYKMPFRVSVYGAGVEVVDEHDRIYKISSLNTI